MKTFEKKLKKSNYPGRGIVIGLTPDNKNIVQVYWIMGRSVNSRNRIFEMDGDFMRTKAFDEALLTDPSLVIYYPIKNYGSSHIVTNGDHTDTIYKHLTIGKTFEDALEKRKFEPDPPNFTPRISGIVDTKSQGYKLAILKTIENNEHHELKCFYSYSAFISGIGHCITTYADDGNPLPSFSQEPFTVKLFDDIDANLEAFHDYLNSENRVSTAVKFINIMTGKSTIKIINENE